MKIVFAVFALWVVYCMFVIEDRLEALEALM